MSDARSQSCSRDDAQSKRRRGPRPRRNDEDFGKNIDVPGDDKPRRTEATKPTTDPSNFDLDALDQQEPVLFFLQRQAFQRSLKCNSLDFKKGPSHF